MIKPLQQVAAPDEPFSFGKPKRQSNVSGTEYFDVETFNNIVYAIRDSGVYYDQDFFEKLYPKLLEQLIEAGLVSETQVTELTDEGNSYERNVLLFNGDSDESFFSIYLQSIYDTYLDRMSQDTLTNLFGIMDNEEQKSQLLLLFSNMETTPNYAQTILDNYDSDQLEALSEVLEN